MAGYSSRSWGQGICVLNWELEKIYENERAKKIFFKHCPDLFQHFRGICQNADKAVNAAEDPLSNHSGIFRYPTGTVIFSCLGFSKGDRSCFYIFFNYFQSHFLKYASLLNNEDFDATVLTPREKEVLQVLAMRKTTREISEILGISIETVRSHIHRIYAKTGVSSRMELMGKVLKSSP